MAITVTDLDTGVTAEGDRWVEATVSWPASYIQGDTVSARTQLGISEVNEVWLLAGTSARKRPGSPRHQTFGNPNSVNQYVKAEFTDPKNPILRLVPSSAGTEAAAASNQSALKARLRFVGN